MFELTLDVLFASLFIYVYFSQAQDKAAAQVEQELDDVTGDWGKVYDAFWYGEPDDSELYVTKGAPEKMLAYDWSADVECENCGHIAELDDCGWCADCNADLDVHLATQAYRDGELEDADLDAEFFPPCVPVFASGSLDNATIRELKAIASRNKVKGYGSLTKQELKDSLYGLRF